MPTKHKFNRIVSEYIKFRDDLPKVLGQEAVNFAKDNFRKQGFQDAGIDKWKPRSAGSPRNKGRAILVDTGRLKRSVAVLRITRSEAWIGSDTTYARIHNEGGRIQATQNVRAHTRTNRTGASSRVRAHTRKIDITMPRRRFIGSSIELRRRFQKTVREKLLKALKRGF